MGELKVTERMALVREEAMAALPALDEATKIGTGTFVMTVNTGYARITVTAIKDEEFDVEGAKAEYDAALALRAAKVQEKADAKAAKEAEKAAKKAAKEAADKAE